MVNNRWLFQLYLLSQMRSEDAIGRSLSSLGASRSDMVDARKRMINDGFEEPGVSMDNYERLLGPPDERGNSPSGKTHEQLWTSYRLETWPSLHVVIFGSLGGVTSGLRFERPAKEKALQIGRLEDLTAWETVLSDLPSSGWKIALREEWYPMLDVEVEAPASRSNALLLFDFELLQVVHVSGLVRTLSVE